MLVEELFKKHDVECPEWLKGKFLEDDWNDSEYSSEGNSHKWVLKTPMKHLELLFTGEEYLLTAYVDGMEYMLEWSTEDTITLF